MASYGYTFTSGDTVTPTKLNNARTVSEIVNADINASAAIAGTKITPNFGSQTVSTTGSGSFASLAATGTAGSLTVSDSTRNVAASIYADDANHVNIEAFAANNSATKRDVCLAKYGGKVGIATTTMNERLNVNGSIHLAEGSLKYFTTASEHLAFTKKAGPYHFYFRKTDDGTAGGANPTDMMVIKNSGQVRFVPLASDPAGAETGDVYYNSATNKLKVYNGTSWVDLH